jgi:hypothetical protein
MFVMKTENNPAESFSYKSQPQKSKIKAAQPTALGRRLCESFG